jgi:hypothetical protein
MNQAHRSGCSSDRLHFGLQEKIGQKIFRGHLRIHLIVAQIADPLGAQDLFIDEKLSAAATAIPV